MYLDTASLSSLIERKTEPETEAVRQILNLGKQGEGGAGSISAGKNEKAPQGGE